MCFYTGDLVAFDGMSTLAPLVRVAEAPEVVIEVSSGNINCSGMQPPLLSDRGGLEAELCVR
jgi:hypothetical protein